MRQGADTGGHSLSLSIQVRGLVSIKMQVLNSTAHGPKRFSRQFRIHETSSSQLGAGGNYVEMLKVA